MLLPKQVGRYSSLPFQIEFSNVKSEPPHYHNELEIVFVLRGTVKYRLFHQEYLINEGELLIVDTEDLHYVYDSSEDAVMINMYIDVTEFVSIYPNIDYMVFACEYIGNEPEEVRQRLENKMATLKTTMSDLMNLTLLKPHDETIVRRKLDELIAILVEHFQAFRFEQHRYKVLDDSTPSRSMETICSVFRYIYENYSEKLTLEAIASAVGFSPSYISHLVKETCGLTLQELINYVRVEFAAKLMQTPSLTLTQVSEYSGFSSRAYFNRCFSEWYEITPSQYRKIRRPSATQTHGKLDMTECISLLENYTKKPVNPDIYMRRELTELLGEMSKDEIWLMLQLARKIKQTG